MRWRHKRRGSTYVEIGRGELQAATAPKPDEGDELVAYRGEDGKLWFRRTAEFMDGRFERIGDGYPLDWRQAVIRRYEHGGARVFIVRGSEGRDLVMDLYACDGPDPAARREAILALLGLPVERAE